MLTLEPRESIGHVKVKAVKPSWKTKIECKYLALKRYLRYRRDSRVQYKESRYTIGSAVLGYGVWVDGYYEINGTAIAFVLSETKQVIFYW